MVPYLPQLWTRRPEVQLPSTPSDEDVGYVSLFISVSFTLLKATTDY